MHFINTLLVYWFRRDYLRHIGMNKKNKFSIASSYWVVYQSLNSLSRAVTPIWHKLIWRNFAKKLDFTLLWCYKKYTAQRTMPIIHPAKSWNHEIVQEYVCDGGFALTQGHALAWHQHSCHWNPCENLLGAVPLSGWWQGKAPTGLHNDSPHSNHRAAT